MRDYPPRLGFTKSVFYFVMILTLPPIALGHLRASSEEAKTIVPNETDILFQFSIFWRTGNVDAESLIEFLTSGISPIPTPTTTMTGVGPTATPTTELGPTQTPTESGGEEFNFQDFFVLEPNSSWHYTGVQGTGTDDDFSWTVENEMQDVGGGKMATRIRTNTDDPSDEFNEHVDFWYKDPAGQIFYHGFYLPQAESVVIATIPAQDILFTEPVLMGRDGMTIGETIIDSGTGEVLVQGFGGNRIEMGSITSTIRFAEFLPNLETPLGVFTNVLRVVVDISVEVAGFNFEITNSTFFLKEGVGMIAQDQEPDPNDAEIQAIDEGQVNGVQIVPN